MSRRSEQLIVNILHNLMDATDIRAAGAGM